MPAKRQEYAIVEWDFIRFDPRYRTLSVESKMAYLHLWVTCIHLRRCTFSKVEIEGPLLPDMCGVSAPLFASMITECLDGKLLTRRQRGIVTVDGLKRKHPALKSWNDDRTLTETSANERDPVSDERKGKERKGFKSTPSRASLNPSPKPRPIPEPSPEPRGGPAQSIGDIIGPRIRGALNE